MGKEPVLFPIPEVWYQLPLWRLIQENHLSSCPIPKTCIYRKAQKDLFAKENYMDLMEAICSRKTCRGYLKKEVEAEKLQMVLEAAMAAPAAMGAYDRMHFTVLQDEALIERISVEAAEAVGRPDARPLYHAPVVIFVSCKKEEDGSIGASSYLNAACVVQNILLAATSLNLGSTYIRGCLQYVCSRPELLEALEIPEGMIPLSAALVGYCQEPIARRSIPPDRVAVNHVR